MFKSNTRPRRETTGTVTSERGAVGIIALYELVESLSIHSLFLLDLFSFSAGVGREKIVEFLLNFLHIILLLPRLWKRQIIS